jgi:hypothetical protein
VVHQNDWGPWLAHWELQAAVDYNAALLNWLTSEVRGEDKKRPPFVPPSGALQIQPIRLEGAPSGGEPWLEVVPVGDGKFGVDGANIVAALNEVRASVVELQRRDAARGQQRYSRFPKGKGKPSAARPCRKCGAADHWESQCPN